MMIDYDSDDAAWVGPVELGPLARGIGFALRRAQAAVTEDFAARFGPADITPSQYAVLSVLRLNPGLRQTQVSFAVGIKRTNFVPLLDALEKRGLAERRRVPGDRRAAALFLTKDGAALLDWLDLLAQAQEARFVARLGGADNHAALIGLLHRMADRSFDLP